MSAKDQYQQVIKWRYLKDTATPMKYSVFMRQMNEPGNALHGHILVNQPVSERYEKRDAIWLDPATVWVEWIRWYLA